MVGEHMALNACAAAAVARHFGLPLPTDRRAARPRRSRAAAWRMEVATTPGGVTVVNDAYNANPESMRAALRSLAAMRGTGRTFAVLGEMARARRRLDRRARCRSAGSPSGWTSPGRSPWARAPAPLYLGAAQEGSWDGEAAWVARRAGRGGDAPASSCDPVTSSW